MEFLPRQIFKRYIDYNFRLFSCRVTKQPDIGKKDWRDESVHLTAEQAEDRVVKQQYVGAWIPEDIIILDVDNRIPKNATEPKTGVEQFAEFLPVIGVTTPLTSKTFTVRTGGGGYHIFFKRPKELIATTGTLIDGVDIKTHTGYVIAAGTPGYNPINNCEIIELPEAITQYIHNKIEHRKTKPLSITVDNPLPPSILSSVLKKIDVHNFRYNDIWLEFIMSIIATCGNSEEILDVIEEWSRTDELYTNDTTISSRLHSIEPDGGITPATFVYILKIQGVSKYLIQKVKDIIGGSFIPKAKKKYEIPLPFDIDIETLIKQEYEMVAAFFYIVKNTLAMHVVHHVLCNMIIYIKAEKQFYYFDGNKWISYESTLNLLFTILMKVTDAFYLYALNGETKNPDLDEARFKVFSKLSERRWKQDTLEELKFMTGIIHREIAWDSPKNAETITCEDCVIDFTGDTIEVRKGLPEEYRKNYIDITEKEFTQKKTPFWDSFLEQLFPNEETRRTAKESISLMTSGLGTYRMFQLWHGRGRNGKSTLIQFLQKLYGKRAVAYPAQMLMSDSLKYAGASSVTPHLAKLEGVSVAFASESEDGKKLSATIVKNLTGDDIITANPKNRDPITFQCTFQLIMATNYLPQFDSHDKAFIDRLLVLPFESHFYVDKKESKEKLGKYLFPAINKTTLEEQFHKERGAILHTTITDYVEFRKENRRVFVSPDSRTLKNMYIQDNDNIGDFIKNFFTFDVKQSVSVRRLAEMYQEFTGNQRVTSNWVSRQVCNSFIEVRRGLKQIDGKMTRVLFGLQEIERKEPTDQESSDF